MSSVTIQDSFVKTARGQLFTRRWMPDAHGASRPAIIMLHDSLGCIALWRDFPERLAVATNRTIIAYDRLGFGQSDPYPGPIGLDLVEQEGRQDLTTVLNTLDVQQFILFGHSVGGGMSIAAAAHHADTCRAAIAESAQTFAEPHTLAGVREARIAFAQPEQLDRLKKYHGDKAAWVLEAWIETWLSPHFADWNLDASLTDLRCPLLSLHGDNDEYGTLAHPQRIRDLAGSWSTCITMEGCGHVPHRDRPETVVQVIHDWLQHEGL